MTVTINDQDRPPHTHAWKLFAPVAALVLFTMVLAVGAVWFAVEQIDRTTTRSSSRLAITAVENLADRMAMTAKDYAFWDDTIENVLQGSDPEWGAHNLGDYISQLLGTSATMVIDAGDTPIFTWSDPTRPPVSEEEFAAIAADLAFAVANARQTPMDNPKGVFCLVWTPHGLAVAGMAAITPETLTPAQMVPAPRPVLIFLRPMDEAWLARTGERFGLGNLRILEEPTAVSDHAVTLYRSDGSLAGAMDWDALSPGLAALRDLALPAVALLLLALGASAVVVTRAIQAQSALVSRADALADANEDLVLRDQQVRSALQRAEHATRAKSSFLARISHEIRTPLTAIVGFSQILKLQHRPNREKTREQEYAEIIHESSQHLLALVNDLLDLSKIESGGFEINESWVDLSREVSNVRTVLGVEADRKGVSLSLDMPDDLPALYADAKTIRQILTNLVSNALKFTATGGRATIRIRPTADGSLTIVIADNGAGIAEEDRQAIWEPFTRARNPALAQTEGTGLGLYLVKMLAELHGAEVSLDSELGKGTTVVVTFGPERVRAVAA